MRISHRTWLILALIVGCNCTEARTHHATVHPSVHATTPKESDLVEHRHYVNKFGNVVHSPSHSKTGIPPTGASAKCGDGTYSFSQHARGTCSHHGGIAR
jgi:Protein of unknown function (DUF3761)